MMGAALSPGGGVRGAMLVSIADTLPVRGRSGEDATELCGDCRSGNIDPILDATLLRLLSAVLFFSLIFAAAPPPPALRSGLVLGLVPRRGCRASFNRPTGDAVRF